LPMKAAPFVYEDVRWLGAVHQEILWTWPSRALTNWSFQLQAELPISFGLPVSPLSFHILNVGVHLVNSVLIAIIALPMIGRLGSVFASGMFALHPLMAEAVSYVAVRGDLLMTFCALIALWGLRSGQRGVVVAGVAMILAGWTKEIGVVVAALMLWTCLIYGPHPKRIGYAVGVVALLCLVQWPTFSAWMTLPAHAGGSSLPWSEFFGTQVGAFFRLLALVVWPVGFTVDHDMATLSLLWRFVGGWLTFLAVLVMVKTWRQAPVWTWASGWILLAVLPRLVVPQYNFLSEHQMYLPMVAMSVLGGMILAQVWQGKDSSWLMQFRMYINRIRA
jgi:hypothetical protein